MRFIDDIRYIKDQVFFDTDECKKYKYISKKYV